MKNTMYFKSVEEMNQYFPNGVPSGVLAICGEETDSKVLYTYSNNELISGTTQGGYTSSPETVERLSYLEQVVIDYGYIVPDGTKEISVNGDYDVSSYANVTVSIEGQTEFPSKEITENGHVNVASYGFAYVSVPVDWDEVTTAGYIVPAGTKEISENGSNIDVASYSNVSVSVPVPSGYVLPAGTRNISESGTFDVTTYASAYVDIPRGIDYTEISATSFTASNGVFDNIENGTDVDVKVILGPNAVVTPFSNLTSLDSDYNTDYFTSHPSYYAIQPFANEPLFIVSTTLPSGWVQEGVYSVKGKSLTFEHPGTTLNLITEVSSISAVSEGGLGTKIIGTNGDYTVNDYYKVSVSVDTDWDEVAMAGYVLPVGTYNISDNGTFDVSSYESAYVDIPPVEYPVVGFEDYWGFEDGDVIRLSALLYGTSDNDNLLEVYPISALSYLESNYETNDYITNHPNSYIVLTATPYTEGEPYLVFDYDPTNPPRGELGLPLLTGVYSIKGSTITWLEKGSDSESSSSSGSTSGISLGSVRLLEQISSIDSIPEGGRGNLSITNNNTTVDVSTYQSVSVNVPTSGGSSSYSATFEHSYFFPIRDAVWVVTDLGESFEFSGFIVDPDYYQAFTDVPWGEQGTITVESWVGNIFKQTSNSVFVSDNNNIKYNTDVYTSTTLTPSSNSTTLSLKVGKEVSESIFGGDPVNNFNYAYWTNTYFYGPDKLNKNNTYEGLSYVDLGITDQTDRDIYIVAPFE